MKTLESQHRLPWPLLAAALVAFTAHYLTTERFFALPIFALLMIVSQLTRQRLPRSRLIVWSLRAGIFSAVAMLVGLPDESIFGWYMKPHYTNLIGDILAAELVIRCWEMRGPESRGGMLLLICLIFAAAGVSDNHNIQLLAPIFVIFVMFSLRSFLHADHRRGGLVVLRIFAAMVALVLGLMMVQGVQAIDRGLPRWTNNLFNPRSRQLSSAIGLTTSPQLEASFNPEESTTRQLVIDGTRSETYLRCAAFDAYDHGKWTPDLYDRRFADVNLHGDESGTHLHVKILGDTADLLPLPLNTTSIESLNYLQRDEFGAVKIGEGNALRYDAFVSPQQSFQGPLCLPLIDSPPRRERIVPASVDEKVVELAKKVAGTGDARTKLTRLVQHLQATHSYSLTYDPGENDPVSNFILKNGNAHCQYFASALVVMARAVGVPARYVTGFYAHESYGGDRLVVRDRDAHAWAECWIDGVGWITMDATPAGGRPDAQFAAVSRMQRWWEKTQDLPAEIRQWLGDLNKRMLLSIVLTLATVAMVVWVIRGAMRAAPTARHYAPPSDELVTIGKSFEKWLRKTGVRVRFNRTWREQVPAACLSFIEKYDQARFGGAESQTISDLRKLLHNLEEHHG